MPEIEQPKFDELATSELADVEEAGEAHILDNTLRACANQAAMVATYYGTLVESGIPHKRATDLTHHWMDICAEIDE